MGVLISGSRFMVLGILGPSEGVPVIPHYLSLNVALDITVMADSDSMLDCGKVSTKSTLFLLYTGSVVGTKGWAKGRGPGKVCAEETRGQCGGPAIWRVGAEAERGKLRKGMGGHGKGAVYHPELGDRERALAGFE